MMIKQPWFRIWHGMALCFSVARWRHITWYNSVDIGSGNCLLLDSTDPLPEKQQQQEQQQQKTKLSDACPLCWVEQTHWGRDKMAAISQTTFSDAFSWMKMYEFRLRFHWSLFSGIELTISQHWFRWWLGAVQATSHFLNQWWLVYRRIYASLGLNELILIRPCILYICWPVW